MRKVGYTGPALYSVGTVRMLPLLSLTLVSGGGTGERS